MYATIRILLVLALTLAVRVSGLPHDTPVLFTNCGSSESAINITKVVMSFENFGVLLVSYTIEQSVSVGYFATQEDNSTDPVGSSQSNLNTYISLPAEFGEEGSFELYYPFFTPDITRLHVQADNGIQGILFCIDIPNMNHQNKIKPRVVAKMLSKAKKRSQLNFPMETRVKKLHPKSIVSSRPTAQTHQNVAHTHA